MYNNKVLLGERRKLKPRDFNPAKNNMPNIENEKRKDLDK